MTFAKALWSRWARDPQDPCPVQGGGGQVVGSEGSSLRLQPRPLPGLTISSEQLLHSW